MDIYCQRCGEPWDVVGLHSGDVTPPERKQILDGDCCPCCKGKDVKDRPLCAEATEVLMDLLGDDIDGLAATLEDFGF